MSVCYHLKIECIHVNIFCTLSPVPSIIYGFSNMNPSLTTYITIYVRPWTSQLPHFLLWFTLNSPFLLVSYSILLATEPTSSAVFPISEMWLPSSLPVCLEQKLGSQSCFTLSLTYLYNKLLAFKSISYFESGKYIELYSSCQKHFF